MSAACMSSRLATSTSPASGHGSACCLCNKTGVWLMSLPLAAVDTAAGDLISAYSPSVSKNATFAVSLVFVLAGSYRHRIDIKDSG